MALAPPAAPAPDTPPKRMRGGLGGGKARGVDSEGRREAGPKRGGRSLERMPFWNPSRCQGDSAWVTRWHRVVAMLRLLVASARIPEATGAGPGVHVSARFRGVPRSTRVLPEERSPAWNETLAWPLGTCPLRPTDTLTLRLRRWGQPVPQGALGAATVSLEQLVANPGLPLSLSHVPLLDPQGQPTGVRVRVIEGHQLQGNDIKPVVTVLIGQKRFRTRIQTGNNPYYNEVFWQNFRRTPARLAAELIVFQVLDSRATRAKAIIGIFQLDIGTIYHAPGRSLSWKWLSLQHPQHPESGSRGYLRVSLAVLRAGETAPEEKAPAGDEDVEANLLRPSPCVATLQLRVYRAEDLPQADPPRLPVGGKRGFVAAAVRVQFAGRTLCTRVMPPDANPVWNEVFFFPLRLPPICDEIQLAILSGSRSSKVLGTATLHLSQISSAGAELEEGTPGFLPCFGPSFLPFYGPRSDPARTSSTDIGVAYRGRVLLELSTHMGTPDGRQRGAIAPEDVSRVQRHLPQCRRFGLCGVFYSATMVPPGPELLRFELSLGHYGDTSDATCKPTASVTPHCCPLFDGNRYHYLPWYGDKPVAAVTSSWEDAGDRWDTLNLLRSVCRRLVSTHGQALARLEEQPTPTVLDAHLRTARLHLLRHLVATAAEPPRAGWDTLLDTAQGWLRRVTALAVEPQAGVPDVLLWLLQGDRRVACARVPAPDIMFSPSGPSACGRFCGRIQTLFLVGSSDIRAQLRLRLWLGRVANSGDLTRHLEGTLHVYAETYENQTKLLGKWGPRGLLGCPCFSDSAGKAGLPRHRIRPPRGWRWDGPWTVEPQRRLLLDAETNVGEVLEEVYENESRQRGGEWGPAAVTSTDVSGAAVPPKEEVACPQGWHIAHDWHVDVTGAVDEAGWEYGTSVGASGVPPAWHATEKTYHTLRRRRWLRTRRRDPGMQGPEQDVETFLRLVGTHSPEAAGTEAWEYGSLWGSRFHLQPRLGDVCRRRCWHRGMVPNQPGARAALFLLEGTPSKEDVAEDDETPAAERPARSSSRTSPKQPMPLILCNFQRPNFFQLRCYIFQALELAPRATKATADPVAHVSFVHVSQSTRVLPGTLDPLWDQTLLFQRVLLYGDPQGVQDEPPMVVVEVFDQDGGGAGAFLGRSVCTPQVWLDVGQRKPPRLQRYPLGGPGGPAGELLAAFELLHDTQDGALAQVTPPPWREGVFSVPQGIRPLLRLVALEVLAWGLRGLQGGVRAPSLELQCRGQTLRTPPILTLPTNPNFPINAFLLPLNLPAEEEYVPPIWLRVLDTREFGYRPVVGQACVRGLGRYYWPPPGQGKPPPGPATPSSGSAALWGRIRQAAEEEEEEDEDDWWSKFYAAMGDKAKRRTGRDRLKIYSCELEALPEFEGLQDFCQTFPLYAPGGHPTVGDDPVGEFKGLFRIYPLPEDPAVSPPPRHFQQLPPSQPQKCLVRVYVVRAFDLPPKDRNRLCDPYVRVSLGKKQLGQRDQYVPNTLEPVFGRLFEVTGTIPLEKDLRVTLLDYDVVPPDQEIGTTTIDLENRLLSHYRANCGLAARYRTWVTGPGCWRDQLPPSRILEHFAHTRGLPAPEFSAEGTAVTFGDQTVLLSQFEGDPPVHQHPGPPRERLALHVLHRCHLVPEHLETRTLYNSTQPGMEQGKVQMWVDVFPTTLGSPGPPVNITPPKPQRYELRCVVWNTQDVDMGDVNLIGQQMSDIYVMGWLDGLEEQRQRTDIHYRSLLGEGAFNWRFVFSFQCLAAEELCILPRKEHFWSLDPTVRKVPPKLILQVWDNDKFSADDFLGILELELSRLPQPAQQPQSCTPNPQGTSQSPWPWRGTRVPSHFSLFRHKRARGWWPCTVQDGNKRRLSGKLELSLELLTAKEAEERPAGRGRDEPNMYPKLQPPVRPEWSFLWLQAPLRTLRYGLWRQHRGRISLALALLLLLALLLTFIYSTPGYLAMKLVNPLESWRFGGGSRHAAARPSASPLIKSHL
ncbi:fer-1-like protein 5 [Patagioenas fasciata]|uniref:fer-1-like protein 5 n=1 Tax=Patagioenas fasciata TaxID=372321 RepID=UPI0032E8DEAE